MSVTITAKDVATLQVGDVLLYRGRGLYSWFIGLKTWHFNVSHVEVYVGDLQSAASRDGKGVGLYPVRLSDLAYVLRPAVPFQPRAAMWWFYKEANGLSYGWSDLLQFVGLNINGKGMVCSPFATEFLRAGAVPVFNKEPALKIAPFQFLTSELLMEQWNSVSGWTTTPQEAA
jgi:hypothetical protein